MSDTPFATFIQVWTFLVVYAIIGAMHYWIVQKLTARRNSTVWEMAPVVVGVAWLVFDPLFVVVVSVWLAVQATLEGIDWVAEALQRPSRRGSGAA